MLKSTKSENWRGESKVEDKVIAVFYATINSEGQLESMSMNPMDFNAYIENISTVMSDFNEFQTKVSDITKNWEA